MTPAKVGTRAERLKLVVAVEVPAGLRDRGLGRKTDGKPGALCGARIDLISGAVDGAAGPALTNWPVSGTPSSPAAALSDVLPDAQPAC